MILSEILRAKLSKVTQKPRNSLFKNCGIGSQPTLLAVTGEFICAEATRSGLDRCLHRHGAGNLNTPKPATPREVHKSFKSHEPGYLHMDVKSLPHLEHMDAMGNIRLEKQALMTPAYLRAMPDNQVLYLFANKRPALITVTPYFESRDFVRRTKTAPHQALARRVGAAELVPV